MHITFGPKSDAYPGGLLMIDDAEICWPNFSGKENKFNREGDRHFTLRIRNVDDIERLQSDTNEFGDSWNLKIKPATEEYDTCATMKVKVKFSRRGPEVWLVSNGNRIQLNEDTIGCLDDIDIERIDLDIRPYDDCLPNGKSFRAAYLNGMEVVQRVSRFAARYQDAE